MSLPKHYVSGLSQKDKKKQIRSLKKSRKSYKKKTKSKKQKYYTRPRLKSFKNKPSRWRVSFQKKYPQAKTMKEIAKVSGIPYKALQEVKKKGMGAYYSIRIQAKSNGRKLGDRECTPTLWVAN